MTKPKHTAGKLNFERSAGEEFFFDDDFYCNNNGDLIITPSKEKADRLQALWNEFEGIEDVSEWMAYAKEIIAIAQKIEKFGFKTLGDPNRSFIRYRLKSVLKNFPYEYETDFEGAHSDEFTKKLFNTKQETEE